MRVLRVKPVAPLSSGKMATSLHGGPGGGGEEASGGANWWESWRQCSLNLFLAGRGAGRGEAHPLWMMHRRRGSCRRMISSEGGKVCDCAEAGIAAGQTAPVASHACAGGGGGGAPRAPQRRTRGESASSWGSCRRCQSPRSCATPGRRGARALSPHTRGAQAENQGFLTSRRVKCQSARATSSASGWRRRPSAPA